MIDIEWKAVDRPSSDRPFAIEAESGLRIEGVIQEVPEGLAVLTTEETVALAPASVARMNRVRDGAENGFWRRLQGTADIGYTLIRGNSRLNQASLGVSARYRNRRYQLQADLPRCSAGNPTPLRPAATLDLSGTTFV